MKIREQLEKRETKILSKHATLSMNSKGREKEEKPCDIRPCFQRDRDRILYSKSFRRLKDKTQVFLSPDGDHYRTRMTHTLEVSQNARTIAKALLLNEDLAEAIALGHDLGHTPFGHAGERALNEVCPGGFRHNEQSLRIVEKLENYGQGMNLTWEVRDGILNHEMDLTPSTLEGKVVRLSDKIAYMHHDMDDAIRGGIITEDQVPKDLCDVIGHTNGEWLDTFIHDIVANSLDKDDIRMSEEIYDAFHRLRKFMFDRVYTNPIAKGQEGKVEVMIKILYFYYLDHVDLLPDYLKNMMNLGETKERIVCDYVSSMTDRYAVSMFEEVYIPHTWGVL
ncbi:MULTISPECIES: deoxyguanosinetriphosphate triphosphohydrolase [unclassified Butyrivibrio]|uniref:deoxyguanosinetriphosphate triphosphohydrolase n=1 Tax=unclassified Butyrivibrio TaxID=2639466 RepID=UPI000CDF0394|nr:MULTISPECIES: deoxyguanosinetriphosphate triphosphohydrolase [unclassified Butyrivibrio]MBP3819191.1 deoxyguanosinetriphosphate triphosphohydrolase [Butyrivibrio sp.]MBQ9303946.1 deoxyguanosinetriphosphate triphosphohydrolase [Butyrivibrio sp.]